MSRVVFRFGDITAAICLTNWTFGIWTGKFGRKRVSGLDVGPLEITYEKRIVAGQRRNG